MTQELTATPTQRPTLSAVIADAPPDALAPAEAAPYQLVDALGRIARLIALVKAEFAAQNPAAPADYGAMSLLIALVEGGPKRAGALADAVLMDPSQVSRRVAALVRNGLVERRADSADGRAILLAATPGGRELCVTMMCSRAAYLREVVQDWPATELTTFVTYLDRFAAQLERAVVPPVGDRTGPGTSASWSNPVSWNPRPRDG